MKECSKSIQRRLSTQTSCERYFNGDGLDIGGKPDPLLLYKELFSAVEEYANVGLGGWGCAVAPWGGDSSFDFVHSSHCLEHLIDPAEGLRNWLRVVREGGYLVITVPDEDLYEQGVSPARYRTTNGPLRF